jgi:hypothetical protein
VSLSLSLCRCGGAGVYCPAGSGSPTSVLPGMETIGSEYSFTRTDQRECRIGSYCTNGIAFPCQPGRYTNKTRETECVPCMQGKGISEYNSSHCEDCQAGFVGPVGRLVVIPRRSASPSCPFY